MKLKIVIKVPMHSEKVKSKALQIVVAEEGVNSVSVGKENDEIEVIGEGVDSVCLVKSLRKKCRFADIVSVEEVKPPPPPPPEPSPPPSPPPCCPAPPPLCIYPPPFDFYDTERPPNWFCM